MLRLRHPISLLVITLLIMVGVLRSFTPPEPVGADAPDVVFSAARAEAILESLLRENVPHVSGSPYNTVVKNRVVAQLQSSGYETQIQSRFHCNPQFGSCSPVENVIAVKQGADSEHAVLITAHYDSGWTGAGAADDGAGMAAVLEIARMAAAFPAFRNDIIFLISDSEENGLIGADAFAEHHPLFEKVRAVVNLEARGVTGASGMFETGDGNRSIIRMFAKNVDRPVANSLGYEIYKRMPNDTDYSVYKRKGVMGLNFAFAQGVPVYHSAIDDIEHLDLGSLQHHGDNAWAMMNALGERRIGSITSREDAGYIDIFANRVLHYPVSITRGLDLFLGVLTMLIIAIAFRKVFRFKQLRWGLLAVPFLLVSITFGGFVLSFPLGHWPDLHPLEHPYPWTGRVAIFLMLALAGYSTLKLFSGRVSPCAWLIIAWGLIFAFGMTLTSKMPAASHVALLPLGLFVLGSLVDLFRKKSPAPLLIASLLGFMATAFLSFYHFFMLDVVMNFDQSHIKASMFWLMALTVMPMLLAYVGERDLDWRPAKALLAAILVACVVHYFLPGHTPDRPRGMTLMYSELEGEGAGHLVLESPYQNPDMNYARGHEFEVVTLNSGRLGSVERPAREVTSMNLPGIDLEDSGARQHEQGFKRELQVTLPAGTPLFRLTLPLEAEIDRIWLNDQLALDTSLETKRSRRDYRLQIVNPPVNEVTIRLESRTSAEITAAAVTWHELPAILVSPFMGNWPEDAQPFLYGPRAEKIQEFTLR